jgi:hypothetical protein
MDVDADIDSTNSMEIIGLDDMKMRAEIVLPQPLRTEGKNEFAITTPIRMQNEIDTTMELKPIQFSSDIDLDVKPVVMDFCFKLDFGGPPPTCIRQPYSHHFGVTLFGMEILGFNFAGESQVIIDELPKRPQIAWGSEKAAHHHAKGRDEGDVRIRFE